MIKILLIEDLKREAHTIHNSCTKLFKEKIPMKALYFFEKMDASKIYEIQEIARKIHENNLAQ